MKYEVREPEPIQLTMSVRRFHNKYRAAVDYKGQRLQVYFDTHRHAHIFCEYVKLRNLEGNLELVQRNMMRTKRDKSLPVGIIENIPTKEFMKCGRKSYCTIAAHITFPDGSFKLKNITYGTPRTRNRETAIKMAIEWRALAIKEWYANAQDY